MTIECGNKYPGRDKRCALPCGHDGGHQNNGDMWWPVPDKSWVTEDFKKDVTAIALRSVREDIDHQAVNVGDALAIIDRHLRRGATS